MTSDATEPLTQLKQQDEEELLRLIQILELSEGATTIFAIAPEPSPAHPVIKQFHQALQTLTEPFQVERFHYSDRAFYEFLYSSEKDETALVGLGRRLVMIYGLDQLPTDRLVREMDQLNRGRETIAKRNLVLIFWLNKADFLDEFRNRAPDFWDWRGKVITFQTLPPLNPLLYPYLEWLISENSYLKMGGIMQVNRQVDIFLDQIYVSLQGEWVEEWSQSVQEQVVPGVGRGRSSLASPGKLGEPDTPEIQFRDDPILEMSAAPSSRQRVTKTVDLAEAVRKHDYGVILGDPGAGKTTLLRYLVRHFAIASRDSTPTVTGEMQEDLGQTFLPILFRIANYAERLAKQPRLSLVDYLKQFYRQWEQRYSEPLEEEAVATLLLNKMAAGDCLLLLDGLDEVFDQANRVQVVQQINQLVDAYPANKFVITSRIAGYQETALGSRFREFTITAMGDAQIEQFLQRWCLAIEVAQRPEADASVQKRDAEREAQGIMQAIATKPGVRRFAANPLLLTILALIHRNGTQMPQRRVELYDLATKTLIEDWQLGRNIAYGARQRQLALVEEEVTALLAPLAFQMHEEKPSGLVEQEQVEAWLTPRMAELQGVDEPTALELVQQFLRKVRETTGLFVERAPAVYGFMHLTFEEYFAARHIADNDIETILTIISPYRNQARWNEPILLALGYLSSNPNQINRLIEKLFSNLEDYQPNILNREIRLKNASTTAPTLVWHSQQEDEAQESDTVWQDLLFVGQVLAEVKVKPRFCQRQVEKLILTYLGLDTDYEDEPTQQLLRLLREIETFNHQVLDQLQQATKNEHLSEEQHHRAWAALLYVACGEAGEALSEQVMDIVDRLTPSLFNKIRNLVAELGAEMTPALDRSLEDINLTTEHRQALEFITGLSYLRSDNYDRVIAQLEPFLHHVDCKLDGYIRWVIAIAYENKENYDQGLRYYQQCSEKLQSFILWRNWGVCYRSHKQYEHSLECLQQALAIAQQSSDLKAEANLLWNIGNSYQDWSRYKEAIEYYEQSRDLYIKLERTKDKANKIWWIAACYRNWKQYEKAVAAYQQSSKLYEQLELKKTVAEIWSHTSGCYRDWDKYEDALYYEHKALLAFQKLDDQSNISGSYHDLGRIYQAWGKYEEAIAHYEQSRDRYQQLEKETNVADLWSNLADCYREWGKYALALDAEQQDLAIRQKLDDQPNIALAYWRLGRIYQAWGKYEEAIAHHEQSRDLYQQLEKETNVADLWFSLADCYREWGKYVLALDAEQQDLAIRQKLDDQPNIADAYRQLGRIYQAWGKYEEAIAHQEQSRDLYQQLEKEKDVADLWSNLADCYREWGKYVLALDAEQQDLAIRQKLDDQPNIALAYWRLGRIYQAWGKYEEAIVHYEQSRDLYQQLEKETNVANLWFNLADCYREWGKYALALDAEQQDLAIRQKLDDQPNIALAYWRLGRIYQAWGKYEEAIAHHEQSRDLYQQLEKETNVADLWFSLADCYREWGKYVLALDAEQQDLAIRQKLDDQPNIADAYRQLGRIYQAWGKYEEAIAHQEQSRDLYQQLEKEKDVADLWSNLADCYREWGKYVLALDAEQQDLAIRQKLDDQPNIALAYWRLGRIYQAWGKYEEAIAHHEQSRDRYQQLEKEKDVADLWFNLADCYREWGKYVLALDAEQQDLAIRQKLDDQPNIADAYRQLGRIYQAWGKYEEAIAHHEQSRDRYQQLEKEKDVADLWSNLADCYREWGKYALALDAEQQDLAIRQKLDDQPNIADAYRQLGRIYQAWGKYEEAIVHYEQSCDLYQQLDDQKNIAGVLHWLGNCHQAWGKYEKAIAHHDQSRDLYQQLEKETNVANQWYWIAVCYREWGKYAFALDAEQQDLAIRQKLDDQLNIADAYRQLGRIYQAWSKYEEAIAYYEQSRDRYETLDLRQDVANLLSRLAVCYQELKDYATATDYYQHSIKLYQAVGNNESVARRFRQLSKTQRLWAKTCSSDEVTAVLHQAKHNLQQAINLDTAGDYHENLAYDQIYLALLSAEYLRCLSETGAAISERITHFKQSYTSGFNKFTELGQVVDKADEALEIARAYLEITDLEDLDQAEALARQSLQTFQAFNRRKLEAEADKLLGEIYLKRAASEQPEAAIIAKQFLSESLRLYRELTLTQKAEEVAQLLDP